MPRKQEQPRINISQPAAAIPAPARAPSKPGGISRIKDLWGGFFLDLNFRCKPPYGSNQAGDYAKLTPEQLFAWHKAIHSDKLAWVWCKLQSGHVIFPSRTLPAMINLPADFFQRWCKLAKAAGMYVMGYTCGGDDIYAFEQHPEWFREYGHAFACLNATPFWEREFAGVQEALRIFPCDGFFYDMVRFSGKCRCEFCRAAYQKFYGEKMPGTYDTNRFRFDTFKHWAEKATRIPREIVPAIEICINLQWMRLDGVPYELLDYFDWYYCEFGHAEWTGEILRAWGDKPVFSGNAIEPRYVAHLLGRRISPLAYDHDIAIDYRTGRLPPLNDPRVARISASLREIRKREPYLKDAVAIPHAAALFTSAYDLSKSPEGDALKKSLFLLAEEKYAETVATCVRDATWMNLGCCGVEIVERLTNARLDRYEIVFVPELARVDQQILALLRAWVERGGILFASGPFALADEQGKVLLDFADDGLLGVKRVQGPLAIAGALTSLSVPGAPKPFPEVLLGNVILCESQGAAPLGHGNVGADKNVPLLWRNRIGKGIVFYLAGRAGLWQWHNPWVQTLLEPHIKRAPYKTSTRDYAEVWLNEQPAEKRLVLHVLAYPSFLREQHISIRSDLVAGSAMEIVYPASKRAILNGTTERGYVTFALPDLYNEDIICLLKSASKRGR